MTSEGAQPSAPQRQASLGCGPHKPKRLGQVIELRPECSAEYFRVHADDHPGVRDLLSKHGLKNFSIFHQVRRDALRDATVGSIP